MDKIDNVILDGSIGLHELVKHALSQLCLQILRMLAGYYLPQGYALEVLLYPVPNLTHYKTDRERRSSHMPSSLLRVRLPVQWMNMLLISVEELIVRALEAYQQTLLPLPLFVLDSVGLWRRRMRDLPLVCSLL